MMILTPQGRFGPLAADHPAVGRTCPWCHDTLVPGDVVSLVGDRPASDEDRAKRDAGRPYTVGASVVHEHCAYPS